MSDLPPVPQWTDSPTSAACPASAGGVSVELWAAPAPQPTDAAAASISPATAAGPSVSLFGSVGRFDVLTDLSRPFGEALQLWLDRQGAEVILREVQQTYDNIIKTQRERDTAHARYRKWAPSSNFKHHLQSKSICEVRVTQLRDSRCGSLNCLSEQLRGRSQQSHFHSYTVKRRRSCCVTTSSSEEPSRYWPGIFGLPRHPCVILHKDKAGRFVLYTRHGVLIEKIGSTDLELMPEVNRPQYLAIDYSAVYAGIKNQTKPRMRISMAQLIAQHNGTAAPVIIDRQNLILRIRKSHCSPQSDTN